VFINENGREKSSRWHHSFQASSSVSQVYQSKPSMHISICECKDRSIQPAKNIDDPNQSMMEFVSAPAQEWIARSVVGEALCMGYYYRAYLKTGQNEEFKTAFA
jgi:hypothetical protein